MMEHEAQDDISSLELVSTSLDAQTVDMQQLPETLISDDCSLSIKVQNPTLDGGLSSDVNTYQTIELKQEDLSIVLDMGMLDGDAGSLLASGGLLSQGCLVYQCDDNIYRISYPMASADSSKAETIDGEESSLTLQSEDNPVSGNAATDELTTETLPQTEVAMVAGSSDAADSSTDNQDNPIYYLKSNLPKTMDGQKSLACTFEGCDRKFSWPTHLKYHMLTHVGKRPYVCEESGCEKSFYTGQRLAVHKRTHTGEKPYLCQSVGCGKSFTTYGNLKNHSRIHSGEKPFVCDVEGCSRGFTELSSLKKHKIVHSGRKPFSCDICGQTFTQSGSRNVHVRKNHTKTSIPLPIINLNTRLLSAPVATEATKYIIGSNFHQGPHLDTQTIPEDVGASDHPLLSTSASVVVLSQPEEMATMATSFPDDMMHEETVYDTNLNVEEIETSLPTT